MKVNLIKLIVFILLMGGFYALEGFERPTIAKEDYRSSGRTGRAWIVTVTMFVVGAILMLWGNTIAEQVDWNVPNGLYPTIGVMVLIAGFIWMWLIRDSARL